VTREWWEVTMSLLRKNAVFRGWTVYTNERGYCASGPHRLTIAIEVTANR